MTRAADTDAAPPLHATDPVVAGFASFTEVLDGEHRSYNEWHMLDHMPEQRAIPGIVHGERWVLSPRCAEAAPARIPPFDLVHYLTCYLLAEPLRATLKEFYALATRLRELDRFHGHRRAHLSGPMRRTGTWAAERVLVSAEAIPYRPQRGVFVVLERHDEACEDEEAVAAVAPALLDHAGVAGIWTFASHPEAGRTTDSTAAYRLALAYCDDDPLEVTARSGEQLTAGLASPGATLLLATPMEAIVPWEWDWFD